MCQSQSHSAMQTSGQPVVRSTTHFPDHVQPSFITTSNPAFTCHSHSPVATSPSPVLVTSQLQTPATSDPTAIHVNQLHSIPMTPGSTPLLTSHLELLLPQCAQVPGGAQMQLINMHDISQRCEELITLLNEAKSSHHGQPSKCARFKDLYRCVASQLKCRRSQPTARCHTGAHIHISTSGPTFSDDRNHTAHGTRERCNSHSLPTDAAIFQETHSTPIHDSRNIVQEEPSTPIQESSMTIDQLVAELEEKARFLRFQLSKGDGNSGYFEGPAEAFDTANPSYPEDIPVASGNGGNILHSTMEEFPLLLPPGAYPQDRPTAYNRQETCQESTYSAPLNERRDTSRAASCSIRAPPASPRIVRVWQTPPETPLRGRTSSVSSVKNEHLNRNNIIPSPTSRLGASRVPPKIYITTDDGQKTVPNSPKQPAPSKSPSSIKVKTDRSSPLPTTPKPALATLQRDDRYTSEWRNSLLTDGSPKSLPPAPEVPRIYCMSPRQTDVVSKDTSMKVCTPIIPVVASRYGSPLKLSIQLELRGTELFHV